MLIKKIMPLLALCSMVISMAAQVPCAQEEMTKRWIQEDPSRAEEIRQFEMQIAKLAEQEASPRAAIIIPVVVHVIHEGEAIGSGTNVSESRINSQLQILNDDFQRLNADASETPSQFANLAADAGIIFCLAQEDPNGNPTTGITRTQYNNVPDINFIEDNIKSATRWNSNRYLNIWVIDIPDPSFLGYSYLPTSTMVGSVRDGLVVDYNRFGFISSTNRGRTATHEIGHYLGLRHMWGSNDNNGNPIGCSSDDGIDDTPNSSVSYFGCPNSGSSCGTNDMYMNYMDYTDDNCMNMFTQGQANVMQGILTGIRSELISNMVTACMNDCRDLEAANIIHGFEPSQSNTDWVIVNANGDDRTWALINQTEDDWGPNQGTGMAIYFWNADGVTSADDYLFSPCLELQKNHKYSLSFSYACAEDAYNLYPEKFSAGISDSQSSADFVVPSPDWTFSPVDNAYPGYEEATLTYIATENKTSSFGFHIFSDADQYALQIDDIRIIDSGLVAITEPAGDAQLSVQPNPTTDIITIGTPSNIEEESMLQLYGMDGKLLRTWEPNSGLASIEIRLKDLPAGVFILKWSDSTNQWTERVVKIEER